MKKTIIYFVVLVVLSVVAVMAYYFQDESEPFDDNNFAIANIEDIQQFRISNKRKDTLVLSKSSDSWMVNNRYKAKESMIELLLQAVEKMYVDAPLAKAAHDNGVRDLAKYGIRVEIYMDNLAEPVKVYYVGGASPNKQGTIMLMEVDGKLANQIYVVKLPGLNGYFTDRFYAKEEPWRNKELFDYYPADIASVEMVYYNEDSTSSFLLNHQNNTFTLEANGKRYNSEQVESGFASSYLMNFTRKTVEKYHNELEEMDSIKENYKYGKLTLTDVSGEKEEIKIFYMPKHDASNQQFDEEGIEMKYDVDRLYVEINDGKDFANIQFYTFGPIFKKAEDFLDDPDI